MRPTLLFIGWLFVVPLDGVGQSSTSVRITREYQIKAAFLCKFVKFIDWSDRPHNEEVAPEPVTICIAGQDPFGNALDQLVELNKRQNNPLKLERLDSSPNFSGCRVLFIGSSEKAKVPEIIRATTGKPILTVSEVHNFIEMGGAIELTVDAQHVEFFVNQAAAQNNGLQISSRLLQLAARVAK